MFRFTHSVAKYKLIIGAACKLSYIKVIVLSKLLSRIDSIDPKNRARFEISTKIMIKFFMSLRYFPKNNTVWDKFVNLILEFFVPAKLQILSNTM